VGLGGCGVVERLMWREEGKFVGLFYLLEGKMGVEREEQLVV